MKKSISFDSQGLSLVGDLYFPGEYNEEKKYTGVVVIGSWTTVKEQMAGLYAQKLAENGFIALAFDSRGYGESKGEPRFYESPTKKIEDIHSAVSYLLSREDVEQVNGFGVCAGAGYMLVAASQNKDIARVATTASWIHDAEAVKMFYGGEEGVESKIKAAQEAKKKFEKTGEVDYIKTISTEDETAAMFGPYDYYLNPERGAISQWSADKFAVMSWEDWLRFDPMKAAEGISVPLLMVHSDGAVLPDYTKKFFEAVPSENKKLVWLNTDLDSPMHQFSFYDQDAEVNRSIEETVRWFNNN